MELYIYPVSTEDNAARNFRKKILESLSNDATTWIRLDRKIDIGDDVTLPLFTHTQKQYQNEPFYFRVTSKAVSLEFEKDKDEASKSMVIGMLTYYLLYNLSKDLHKIEII